jgi:hypothetical protein
MKLDAFEAETILSRAYEDELDLYGQALSLAERLDQDAAEDTSWGQLSRIIGELADLEAGIANTKEEWCRAGYEPGPQLQATLTLVAKQIERLHGLMAHAQRRTGMRSLPMQGELAAVLQAQLIPAGKRLN